MTLKTCIRCNSKQDELQFPKTGRNRSRGNVCLTCRNIRQTKNRHTYNAKLKLEEKQKLIENKGINALISMKW